jgi:uncharacterized membrane protein
LTEQVVSNSYLHILFLYSSVIKLNNWTRNEYEISPNKETQKYAFNFINEYLINLKTTDLSCLNITASPQGEIIFEWLEKEKRLSIFILSEKIEYLFSWGISIYNEMIDGLIHNYDDFIKIWNDFKLR